MKSVLRRLFHFLYLAKQRLFPRLRPESIFPGWNAVQRFFILRSKSNFVDDVLGHKMCLDENDCLALSVKKVFEPFETRFFLENVEKGNVVVDVGANIGYYTLLFARQVGESGRVHAFEPDPGNFGILQKNIELNGYRNVVACRKAVGAATGTAKLYVNPEYPADQRIYASPAKRDSIDIETTKLDDYFAQIATPIDVIKMDVQGSEYGALLGMEGVLAKNPQVTLVTEFWPYGLKHAGAGPEAFLDFLFSRGFEVSEIEEAGGAVRRTNRAELLRKHDVSDSEAFTNLLCRKPGSALVPPAK